jgi:hypothetical protein
MYLGIAVVVSLLGCGLLWLRHRRPTTMEASIKEFSRELGALAPDSDNYRNRGRRSG